MDFEDVQLEYLEKIRSRVIKQKKNKVNSVTVTGHCSEKAKILCISPKNEGGLIAKTSYCMVS